MDGKGNVLLGFEANQLIHVLGLKRRKLDETNKDRLPGKSISGLLLVNLEPFGELFNGELNLRDARGFRGRVGEDTGSGILLEDQTFFGRGEDAHGDPLRTDIECNNRLLVSHSFLYVGV